MGEAHDEVAYTVTLATGETFGPAPMATVVQWTSEGRVPVSATLSTNDGRPPAAVTSVPQLAPLFAGSSGGDDSWATMIPYRNPPALIGYYAAIVSLLPVLGMLAGPAAIVLGAIGLRKRSLEPQCKGAVHAWIAIGLGLVGTLISVGCIGSIVFAMLEP